MAARTVLRQVVGTACAYCVVALYVLAGAGSESSAHVAYSRGTDIVLGSLAPGSHRLRFDVSNKGSHPVEIQRITASCGCTVPSIPTRNIDPWKSVPVTVYLRVEPDVSRTAFLFVEHSGGTDAIRLSFSGENVGELTTGTPQIVATNVSPGEVVTRSVRVRFSGPQCRSAKPVWRWTVVPAAALSIVEDEVQVDEQAWLFDLSVRSSPLPAKASIHGRAELAVGRPSVARIRIPIYFESRQDLEVRPLFVSKKLTAGPWPQTIDEINIGPAKSWSISRIVSPTWIRSDVRDGLVHLWATQEPSTELGAETISITVKRVGSADTAEVLIGVAYEIGQ